MSALDLIVIAAIVFCALLGLWLGVVRVLLGIGGWIGAAVVTVYGFPYARPLARDWIESTFLSDLAAAGTIFIVSLVLLTILSHVVAEKVRGSAFGAVDRSIGLIFGLVLGIIVVSSAFLVTERLAGGQSGRKPDWIEASKTAPLLRWTARFIVSLLPEDWREASGTERIDRPDKRELGRAAEELMTPRAKIETPRERTGYKESERREMDRLFNASE